MSSVKFILVLCIFLKLAYYGKNSVWFGISVKTFKNHLFQSFGDIQIQFAKLKEIVFEKFIFLFARVLLIY